MITFVKYHGTGNDFILIDDRYSLQSLSSEVIRKLCDRHFGIGADGLIQLRNKDGFDFEMLYYNSDGLKGSMCGNGGRCITAFAHSLGIIKEKAIFSAFDGTHEAKIISGNPYIVSLHMNDVTEIEDNSEFIYLDTGSPHVVIYVEDVKAIDVIGPGREIRYNKRFKEAGTNVNFVQEVNGDIYVRTYERGVEDETLSCGTGVTAAVIASSFSERNISSGCNVFTPGGKLKVYFEIEGNRYSKIWLEGKAEKVFNGEVSTEQLI